MRQRGMTPKIEDLEIQIEKLVRDHIAACHRAAAGAVERAFSSTPKHSAAPPRKATVTRSSGKRHRSAEEMEELRQRLFAAVRANPGARMPDMAMELGVSARDLYLPIVRLKSEGRVRSVGLRNATRYFPMAETA